MTTQCPDDIPVPSGALDLYRSPDYWILSASTVHSNGQERKVDFNLESMRVGQTVGCSVNKEGELHYFLDGEDRGIGWTGLPTDKPMWGFADIYGLARKIKSSFIFGERPCISIIYSIAAYTALSLCGISDFHFHPSHI